VHTCFLDWSYPPTQVCLCWLRSGFFSVFSTHHITHMAQHLYRHPGQFFLSSRLSDHRKRLVSHVLLSSQYLLKILFQLLFILFFSALTDFRPPYCVQGHVFLQCILITSRRGGWLC
jgi:hypothetical protein